MKKEKNILNIGITGHRQSILDHLEINEEDIFSALDEIFSQIKKENNNKEIVIHNGFFNGTDFYIAKYAYKNQIKTIFYIPLATNEKYGDEDIQNKKIEKASEFYKEFFPYLTRDICDDYFEIYKSEFAEIKGVNLGFMERNFEIVENSEMLICLFDEEIGRGGGTNQTINFAKEKQLKIFNILDYIKKK